MVGAQDAPCTPVDAIGPLDTVVPSTCGPFTEMLAYKLAEEGVQMAAFVFNAFDPGACTPDCCACAAKSTRVGECVACDGEGAGDGRVTAVGSGRGSA